MKSTRILAVTSLLAIISVFLASPQTYATTSNKPQINKIVVFGDSLSDNGNLYNATSYILKNAIPKSPPYYLGHFSNGPVWVENLAFLLQKNGFNPCNVSDFAVGGANAVLYLNLTKSFELPYTLKMEVTPYITKLKMKTKTGGKPIKPDTLFIVWIGANDYLNGRSNVMHAINSTVHAIITNMETLIDSGAKNFLVLNLPNLGKTPEAREKDAKFAKNLYDLATAHNTALAFQLGALQKKYPNVKILPFDVNPVFMKIINAVEKEHKPIYNITDVTTPCWGQGFTLQKLTSTFNLNLAIQKNQLTQQVEKAFANSPDLRAASLVGHLYELRKQGLVSDKVACSNPDNHLFWDHVHPTRVVHKILADQVYNVLVENFSWKNNSNNNNKI